MWGESSCRCWADTNASFFTYKAGVFTGVEWQLLSNNTMKILILIFCILHHIDGKPYSNSLDFEHHIVPRIKPFEKPSFEGIDSQLITLMVSNYCFLTIYLKLYLFSEEKYLEEYQEAKNWSVDFGKNSMSLVRCGFQKVWKFISWYPTKPKNHVLHCKSNQFVQILPLNLFPILY